MDKILLPPAVSVDAIARHLTRAYGLQGRLVPIAAERDQNHRLLSDAGEYLVKVCSLAEGFDAARAHAAALQHIERADPSLPAPRVIVAQNGAALTTLEDGGTRYPFMVLAWLPGNVLADEKDAAAYREPVGAMVARLGLALRGFSDPAIQSRDLIWNVMQVDALSPHVGLLPEDWRATARQLLSHFTASLKPQLQRLRTQVIHGDVHPWNVVVEEGRVSGIIDFGDMIHAPLVIDPANVIADFLEGSPDAARSFSDVLRGYSVHCPLLTEETAVLIDLVKLRLLSTAIIALMRGKAGAAETESITALSRISLAGLAKLQADEENLRKLCAEAGGANMMVTERGEALLERRKAAMGPKPLLFYSKPLHMLRGDGVWLHADDGRAYLDCYNNVAHVGHCHPDVVEAVSRQLRILNTNTRYITDQSIQYAEALKATVDPSLDTVIFVNSGSEANDVAWHIANVVTGNSGALCMEFAYHGITMATMAVSPSNYPEGKWRAPHVRQLESPDTYRGRFRLTHNDVGEAYAATADAAIAELQKAGFGISMGIIDSAFMTNGIINAPPGYVAGVARRVREAGGLFIADEVQSGFGRMGTHMWGHQHHGVVPDFVTIGKPAGNGYPVGVVITRSDLLERFTTETGPFFSTFGGGNAACAAGHAVLKVMEREHLRENALATGAYFRECLQKVSQRHEIIGDVRGSGFAVGIELVRNRKTQEPAAAETRRTLDLMKEEGVLIGSDGQHGNVLKLRPPLVFQRDHAERVAAALDSALKRL